MTTSKSYFTAVALAALAFLTACGGGDADTGADGLATPAAAARGVTAQGIGGIGGSGVTSDGIGGIGGSGVVAQGIGGIGGSGVVAQGIGGIGGSGVVAQGIGGIGGSGRAGTTAVSAAPACALASVNVTIAGARVNPDSAADLASPGWIDVAVATPVRVNLLSLVAGAALPLDLSALPDGRYGQLRLLLVADDTATPLADSVVDAGGVETALSVPTVAHGGLPLAPTITVAGGRVSASFAGLDVCGAVSSSDGTYALGAVAAGSTRLASSN